MDVHNHVVSERDGRAPCIRILLLSEGEIAATLVHVQDSQAPPSEYLQYLPTDHGVDHEHATDYRSTASMIRLHVVVIVLTESRAGA